MALSLNKIDWFRSLIYPKEQIVKFVKSAFFDHFSSGPSNLGPLEPRGKNLFPSPHPIPRLTGMENLFFKRPRITTCPPPYFQTFLRLWAPLTSHHMWLPFGFFCSPAFGGIFCFLLWLFSSLFLNWETKTRHPIKSNTFCFQF